MTTTQSTTTGAPSQLPRPPPWRRRKMSRSQSRTEKGRPCLCTCVCACVWVCVCVCEYVRVRPRRVRVRGVGLGLPIGSWFEYFVPAMRRRQGLSSARWLIRWLAFTFCIIVYLFLSLSLFLSHFVFSWSPFPLGSPILFLFLFPFPGPDPTLKYCQSAIRCSSVNSLEPLPFSSPFHVLCPFSFGGEVSLMSSIRHWPWLLIRVSSSLEKRSIWNSHERMQAANNQVNPVW